MLRFLDRANAVTLAGLAAALASALLAVHGRLPWALAALVLSGVCDLFDGFIARRLERDDEQRRFGARLDSLVDACAFGFAPVLVLHAAGMTAPWEMLLLGLFAACAVWRLAYFDTVGLQQGHYVGLPTTFVALVIPLAFLAGFHSRSVLRWVADACALGLAVAMVSPFKVKKPGGVAYGVLLLLAVGVAGAYVRLHGSYTR